MGEILYIYIIIIMSQLSISGSMKKRNMILLTCLHICVIPNDYGLLKCDSVQVNSDLTPHPNESALASALHHY